MTTTALEPPHAPVQITVAGYYPDEPDFVDVCLLCCTDWPCLIAHLADLPGAQPVLANTGPYDTGGPDAEEAPF